MQLGDMIVIGEAPAELVKALGVVSSTLHQTFALQPWIAHPEKSKESCILSSLAVRDFLFKVGFVDAEVVSVITAIRAIKDGKEIHSLGIGLPMRDIPKTTKTNWNGHMVVKLPKLGYMIDTTLYQAMRPHWPSLPGMLAFPGSEPTEDLLYGHPIITGFHSTSDDGVRMDMFWLEHPDKKTWKKGGDTIKWRREEAVAKMLERYRTAKETNEY